MTCRNAFARKGIHVWSQATGTSLQGTMEMGKGTDGEKPLLFYFILFCRLFIVMCILKY